MLRFLRYILEFLAALVGVAIICALLLVWRLSSMPISSDFLTPYVETGIESVLPDSKAHLGSTQLTWDPKGRVFDVHIQNIQIDDARSVEIANIPVVDAKISILGLFFGQFVPKELIIDRPQIKLDRDKNGRFSFGGLGVNSTPENTPLEPVDVVLGNISERLSQAIFMRKLAVTHAVFDIHDEETDKNAAISIQEISIKRNALSYVDRELRHDMLDGRIKADVPQMDTATSLDIHYVYDSILQQHSLTSEFSNVTPALVAGGNPASLGLGAAAIADLPLTGKLELVFDKSLTLGKVGAKIHGDKGRLVYADFWDRARPIESLDFEGEYDRAARKLAMPVARIDFGGPVLDIKIDGTPSSREGQDLDFAATIKFDHLPMNKYGEIWPKPVLANPRDWLTSNLRDGTYDHAEVVLKGSLAFNALADLSITEGSGKIAASGGRVTYVEGMPPVEGVGAAATFDLNKMDVQISGGGIGNIRLSPFTLRLTGLADTDQYADIPAQISGPLPDVMRLLDHKPLGYAKALGVAPEDIEGKIAGQVKFHFPLLKSLEMKNLDIHAAANATDVASTKLIPGI
jgi:hypothetical protein